MRRCKVSNQSKELASPGSVKALDKNKNECFIEPKDLVIGDKTLAEKFKEIEDLCNSILNSNKKTQDDHKNLMADNKEKVALIKALSKKIDDATSFAEES